MAFVGIKLAKCSTVCNQLAASRVDIVGMVWMVALVHMVVSLVVVAALAVGKGVVGCSQHWWLEV